jgi:hypothetical protein
MRGLARVMSRGQHDVAVGVGGAEADTTTAQHTGHNTFRAVRRTDE